MTIFMHLFFGRRPVQKAEALVGEVGKNFQKRSTKLLTPSAVEDNLVAQFNEGLRGRS
jgi:hypothetical protein